MYRCVHILLHFAGVLLELELEFALGSELLALLALESVLSLDRVGLPSQFLPFLFSLAFCPYDLPFSGISRSIEKPPFFIISRLRLLVRPSSDLLFGALRFPVGLYLTSLSPLLLSRCFSSLLSVFHFAVLFSGWYSLG